MIKIPPVMFFSNLYISWQTVLKILKNISQFLTADINTGILQKSEPGTETVSRAGLLLPGAVPVD